MPSLNQQNMLRRGFCLCCMGATTLAATGGWLTPRQAFAKARNIVDLIRDVLRKRPSRFIDCAQPSQVSGPIDFNRLPASAGVRDRSHVFGRILARPIALRFGSNRPGPDPKHSQKRFAQGRFRFVADAGRHLADRIVRPRQALPRQIEPQAREIGDRR
jgi:hypothetical protein